MKEKRHCRKCGEYIPYQVVIDKKRKNLQNRKFCLSCSPYGSHNTKTDDPDRISKSKSSYQFWSADQKRLHTARTYKRGIDRKAELIRLAGGECSVCGYSKCFRALGFHHRDPSLKEFGLALNQLWSRSWSSIIAEFEKCDLVCIRCHMEIEDKLSVVNEHSYRSIIAKKLS